jgi:hypothetical protein
MHALPKALASLCLAAFLVAGLAAVAARLATCAYGIKATRYIRRAVDPAARVKMRLPGAVLFRPGTLTEDGLRYRRKHPFALLSLCDKCRPPLLLAAITGKLP